MQFFWPTLLPFLILAPLLVVAYLWAQRRRTRFALGYSSVSLAKDALGKFPGLRRHIPPAFFLLGLLTLLIAIARPYGSIALPKREATVILTIDVSGSMRVEDLRPNRLEAAKAAARLFVTRQPGGTRVGIVAFSDSATVVQPPTTDQDAVLQAINRLSLQRRTAIGSAILASLDAIFGGNSLNQSEPSRGGTLPSATSTPGPTALAVHAPAIIVLLTDGQSNVGPSPLQSAQEAAKRGVRTFTIGVGTPQGGVIPGFGGSGFRAGLDEDTLSAVSKMTDAEYFRASDENALYAIYEHLDAQTIITTERIELTAPLTALGATLFVVSGILSLFWFIWLP